MKSILSVSLFVFLGVCLMSCSPKYYAPSTQNVPLISKKGETNLTLAFNPNQVGFQGAYGLTKNIAINVNGGLFFPSDLDNGDGGSGQFIEVGGGYFKAVADDLVFEGYGIIGFGAVENHFPSSVSTYPQSDGKLSANILIIGIQPDFGYKSKYFSAGISTRFVNLIYGNIKGNLVYSGYNQQEDLANHSSSFLFEPAITLRGGPEKVKFQLQFGYSYNLSNPGFKQNKSYLTIGLNFDL